MNEILEREAAIHLELVAGNDQVVFEDPLADPFTHGDPQAMLEENQELLDRTFGPTGYDLGHVFDTAGGGLAGLGVACLDRYKAQGMSGVALPAGDPFVITYALHEVGHQLGAEHTFNGSTGGCRGNRHPTSAFEPGSGSTIMAYAGICGEEDLQPLSDDHFHAASLDQIRHYTSFGEGARCGQVVPTPNHPPSVEAGRGRVIPALTPFELVGSASDPDGDRLTFAWEQLDLGRASPPNGDGGGRALFRSFRPADAEFRTFPRLDAVLDGGVVLGEALPCTSRQLTFQLTARDQRLPAGGVSSDTVRLVVTAEAGPFRVLEPSVSTVWRVGTTARVRWDPADTNRPPVDCRHVDILFSGDGGGTFSVDLARSVKNDGEEPVKIPAQQTSRGRVKVRCADNVFFAVSTGDFKVKPP
jgi:hypothetical protein